jgi:hypothetical protein
VLQAGLIVGFIALVVALGATLISPLCTSCLALFLGLGAGFLAGVFDKPLNNNESAKSGSLAGVMGGIGATIGQMAGTAANAMIMGPEGATDFVRQLGLPASDPSAFASGYWGGLIASACCFSVLNIALMAGLGALGGLLWWRTTGKKSAIPDQGINE